MTDYDQRFPRFQSGAVGVIESRFAL